jgi:hypothetical protein
MGLNFTKSLYISFPSALDMIAFESESCITIFVGVSVYPWIPTIPLVERVYIVKVLL